MTASLLRAAGGCPAPGSAFHFVISAGRNLVVLFPRPSEGWATGHCPSREGICWGLLVQVAGTKIPQPGALQQQTLLALGSGGFRSREVRVLTDLVSGEDLLPVYIWLCPPCFPGHSQGSRDLWWGRERRRMVEKGEGVRGTGGGGEREKYVSFLKELTPFTRAPPL